MELPCFALFAVLGMSSRRERAMKSLRLRIVLTFTLALIGTSLAMIWISASITGRLTAEFFEGSMKLELQRAQRIYETGGPESLAEYLRETDVSLPGTLY